IMGLGGGGAEQRGQFEAYAFAIAFVINAKGVLRRPQCASDHCGRGLLIRADVVAQRIALAQHAEVERADVAQEASQKLRAYRVVGKYACPFCKNLGARGRRGEILDADGPIDAAMATGAASVEKQLSSLRNVRR